MPKISVIIPTYNHKDFIGPAIESVLGQTYVDYEILVADDFSTDGTRSIVESYQRLYPKKVRALVGDKRIGIAGNVNRALAVAKGEYIAWLGGDDLMMPTKLSEQVTYLNENESITGCHHDAEIFDQSLGTVVGLFSELYSRGMHRLPSGGVEILFDPVAFMLPSTMMFRREAMPIHGFDERLKYTNDWLFDIETFRNGRINSIDMVLGVYRRHSNNVTSSSDLAKSALEEQFLVLGIVQARYPELSRLAKRRRVSLLQAEGAIKFRGMDSQSARLYIKAAFVEGSYFKSAFLYLGLLVFGRWVFKRLDFKRYSDKKIIRRIRRVLRI